MLFSFRVVDRIVRLFDCIFVYKSLYFEIKNDTLSLGIESDNSAFPIVMRAQFLEHFGVGLGVFHAATAQRDGEFETLLRSFGDQGVKPGIHGNLLTRSSLPMG